ncbi:MAG: transposase [Peptococcaceae bacterium]|nr:transposase [Peptococcaceae bacterium]
MFRANATHVQQSLLESTQWMNPKIREKLYKSWAPVFYEHVFCKIDEDPFAVLYGTTGKPNFPVNIMLSLEYIKHMKNCSDIEIIDNFHFDYLVNYATGQRTLGETNLAERTLYYFRERVYRYCRENPGEDDLLFGQFIRLLHGFAGKAGIALGEQRVDTTLFMSNIKKAGRMSLAYDVLVKAVNAIPENERSEALAKALDPDFRINVLYRAKAQECDTKLAILLNLCQEALSLLTSIPASAAEAKLVRRFLAEQAVVDAESGNLMQKSRKDISPSSLQSAHDEEATFRRKGNVTQSGYVLEIAETCDQANPFQLLTDYTVAPNNTSDVTILESRLETIRTNTGCTDMYADGGFHSVGVHRIAEENDIEIHLTNMTGKAPTKIATTEFAIDEASNVITRCPKGHIPTRAGVSKGQTSAHFPHTACENCELRDRCYMLQQAKDCVVRISLKAVNAGRERAKMQSAQKENTKKRAGIEGSNSALKRTGLDKLGVRGIVKSTVVCGLKVTAQNIKRLIKYLQGGYQPKHAQPTQGMPMPILG